MTEPKKYVVVLAHADGWGALSANRVVKNIHEHYPDVGIFLVVSQATKNKDGGILTKLDDLKTPRELKETNLLRYFSAIDAMREHAPAAEPLAKTSYDTFKQLAHRCCDDGIVHYTTRGGPKGGEEVADVFRALEKERGITPEAVLSVDTMAILPETITGRYPCFSTHPGPLDTIKIEGMQGTLRSLVHPVLYDRHGILLPRSHSFGMGMAYVKGTLFLQHPQLDKGPPIDTILTPVCPGMCAYQVRDEVYYALTEKMLGLMPVFLNKNARTQLVKTATQKKAALDLQPHTSIPELDPDTFAQWQGNSFATPDDTAMHGVDIFQNDIVNPRYFKNRMRGYFPGTDKEFEKTFTEIFGGTLEKLNAQKKNHLTDPWALYYSGEPGVTIKQYKPGTDEVIGIFRNPDGPAKKSR